MILKIGEKVHVLNRKQFEDDYTRHFIGVVEDCEGDLMRGVGFLFALECATNKYIKYPTPRTRIIHMGDNVVVNVIPQHVDIDKITYTQAPNGDVIVSDGSEWSLRFTKTLV